MSVISESWLLWRNVWVPKNFYLYRAQFFLCEDILSDINPPNTELKEKKKLYILHAYILKKQTLLAIGPSWCETYNYLSWKSVISDVRHFTIITTYSYQQIVCIKYLLHRLFSVLYNNKLKIQHTHSNDIFHIY